ncbi:hypothetical protein TNCV_2003201 [Trichonephila clavipes]|nr:hypothetical protein TNCV_2003201 [Trichonephila clavipes]
MAHGRGLLAKPTSGERTSDLITHSTSVYISRKRIIETKSRVQFWNVYSPLRIQLLTPERPGDLGKGRKSWKKTRGLHYGLQSTLGTPPWRERDALVKGTHIFLNCQSKTVALRRS